LLKKARTGAQAFTVPGAVTLAELASIKLKVIRQRPKVNGPRTILRGPLITS